MTAYSPAAYQAQLQALLPPGAAWSRNPASWLGRLLLAIGDGLARFDLRLDQLADETDPRSTYELIDDWERLLGLPDPCTVAATTLSARRLVCWRKLAYQAGQTRAFYIALAASLGFNIEIHEFDPDVDEFDSSLAAEVAAGRWRYIWRVHVLNGAVITVARIGDAIGVRLVDGDASLDLECILNSAKPAHTHIVFSYPEEPVETPPAPSATDLSGVSIAYLTAQAIDLSSHVSGVHTSISASSGAKGSVSIAGDVATYTPAAGQYGADSFTFTATGPGGTSAPATVALTIGLPPAPTVSNLSGVSVAYNTARAVDLSSRITGIHGSISASAGAHGTTSVTGDVVTYTPASGYLGADSFTFTATGPGGTSSAATVSLTVASPGIPATSDYSGIVVGYNSPQAIDLSGHVGGVHTSISAGAGAHGTTSVAGDVVTYTPASGYYGADSFTFTATGPGGTSSAATVSLTVANPAAPTVSAASGIAVGYNASQAIDLSGHVGGVHTSISAGAGAHGMTSVAGDVVTYTPTSGYYGADSFTFTATGPGGTSSAATVSLTVATPPPPTVSSTSGLSANYNAPTTFDLNSLVAGVWTSISAGAGAHGSTSVSGRYVTYTPASGYSGGDSFSFTATGPGGVSSGATIGLTVASPPPPSSAATDAIFNVPASATTYSGPSTSPLSMTANASGQLVVAAAFSFIAVYSPINSLRVFNAAMVFAYRPKGSTGAWSYTTEQAQTSPAETDAPSSPEEDPPEPTPGAISISRVVSSLTPGAEYDVVPAIRKVSGTTGTGGHFEGSFSVSQ